MRSSTSELDPASWSTITIIRQIGDYAGRGMEKGRRNGMQERIRPRASGVSGSRSQRSTRLAYPLLTRSGGSWNRKDMQLMFHNSFIKKKIIIITGTMKSKRGVVERGTFWGQLIGAVVYTRAASANMLNFYGIRGPGCKRLGLDSRKEVASVRLQKLVEILIRRTSDV